MFTCIITYYYYCVCIIINTIIVFAEQGCDKTSTKPHSATIQIKLEDPAAIEAYKATLVILLSEDFQLVL